MNNKKANKLFIICLVMCLSIFSFTDIVKAGRTARVLTTYEQITKDTRDPKVGVITFNTNRHYEMIRFYKGYRYTEKRTDITKKTDFIFGTLERLRCVRTYTTY